MDLRGRGVGGARAPGSAVAWDERSRLLRVEVARAKGELDRAQRAADRLQGMGPDHVPVLRALLLADRDYRRASAAYEEFVETTPRPPT